MVQSHFGYFDVPLEQGEEANIEDQSIQLHHGLVGEAFSLSIGDRQTFHIDGQRGEYRKAHRVDGNRPMGCRLDFGHDERFEPVPAEQYLQREGDTYNQNDRYAENYDPSSGFSRECHERMCSFSVRKSLSI